MLETLSQAHEVFEKFMSIVATTVHLHFITLTAFLLALLLSDKAYIFPSPLPVILQNGSVAADCSIRL